MKSYKIWGILILSFIVPFSIISCDFDSNNLVKSTLTIVSAKILSPEKIETTSDIMHDFLRINGRFCVGDNLARTGQGIDLYDHYDRSRFILKQQEESLDIFWCDERYQVTIRLLNSSRYIAEVIYWPSTDDYKYYVSNGSFNVLAHEKYEELFLKDDSGSDKIYCVRFSFDIYNAAEQYLLEEIDFGDLTSLF